MADTNADLFKKQSERAVENVKTWLRELQDLPDTEQKINILTSLIVHQVIKTQVLSSKLQRMPKNTSSCFEPKKIKILKTN